MACRKNVVFQFIGD
jgi:hypothetical protein